jgi:hypothetical protein
MAKLKRTGTFPFSFDCPRSFNDVEECYNTLIGLLCGCGYTGRDVNYVPWVDANTDGFYVT